MPTGTVQKAAEAKAVERDVAKTAALTLREAIRASTEGFRMALPEHVKVERFLRASFTAIQVVPKLADCTQQSVLAGLMQAAQLGLEVADVRGQCYLIPRENRKKGVLEATFQLGYRGMIDLAARSGIIVDAEELHENDDYDYSLGTNRFLRHKQTLGPRGNVLAYYATAELADGRTSFTIMSVYEIEEHRDKFASQRDFKTKEITGPWVEHFDAMARKTVIRARLNYMPVSVELREAMHRDVIDAMATDIGMIDYGTSFQVPADAVTGEPPEPLAAIETSDTDTADVSEAEPVPEPAA
jgi:recombination protein RecT